MIGQAGPALDLARNALGGNGVQQRRQPDRAQRRPGISEIMNQVIGQAGPAMKMAKDALGTTNGAAPPDKTP